MQNLIKYLFFFLSLILSFSVNAQIITQHHSQQSDAIRTKEKLALQYFRNHDYEKASDIYKQLIKKSGLRQNYYSYYFRCLLETQNYKEAEKLAKKQIRKYSENYRYITDLGYIYTLSGNIKKAKKEYLKILKNLPPDEGKIIQIANSFYYRSLSDLCIETYKKGRIVLNNNNLFNLSLANIYYRTGNFSRMIDEYLALLKFDTNTINTIQNRLQTVISGETGDIIEETLKNKLLKQTQQNPENRYYTELLLWLSIQKKEFDFALVQAKSLDKKFQENGSTVFNLAGICLSNTNYDIALEAYDYIQKKGRKNQFFIAAKTGYLNTKFIQINKFFSSDEKEYKKLKKEYSSAIKELGKVSGTAALMRDMANLQAFHLHEFEEAIALLKEAISIPYISEKMKANCKITLGDIYLFTGEVWEATLLYSQVEKALKNSPLAHVAKFKNAKLSYFIGEFGWAKIQLDVLKAATSKLIANDAMELSLLIGDNLNNDSTTVELEMFSKADLLFYQNKNNEALIILDSLERTSKNHSIIDEVIFKKSEINIKQGNYQTADSLLKIVYTDYGFDILADNALMKRAELQETKINNKENAMELYQQLFVDYPGSLFAVQARKRFRTLRGN